jgi:hypothetical protein
MEQNLNKSNEYPFNNDATVVEAHFRRFLTVLEYSPVGEKFPPTNAPRTLYIVKKKIGIFSEFFVFRKFQCT